MVDKHQYKLYIKRKHDVNKFRVKYRKLFYDFKIKISIVRIKYNDYNSNLLIYENLTHSMRKTP